jgi:hypothetical protein
MKRSLPCTVSVVECVVACSSHDLTTPSSRFILSPGDSAQAAAVSAGDATAEDVDVLTAAGNSMDDGADGGMTKRTGRAGRHRANRGRLPSFGT